MKLLRPLAAACLALGLALGAAVAAVVGIPAPYAPIVIQPAGVPARHEFDLSAALARAKRENKRLYVYLGASDCPYCRRYEAFLEQNAAALVPQGPGELRAEVADSK